MKRDLTGRRCRFKTATPSLPAGTLATIVKSDEKSGLVWIAADGRTGFFMLSLYSSFTTLCNLQRCADLLHDKPVFVPVSWDDLKAAREEHEPGSAAPKKESL